MRHFGGREEVLRMPARRREDFLASQGKDAILAASGDGSGGSERAASPALGVARGEQFASTVTGGDLLDLLGPGGAMRSTASTASISVQPRPPSAVENGAPTSAAP